MSKLKRVRRFFWKTPKWIFITLGLLIGLRIALPYILKAYVNWSLEHKIEGYTGHVEDIDLLLIAGAYSIEDLTIKKVTGHIPVPFIDVKEIDFSLLWKALFRGRIVADMKIVGAKINFVDDPDASKTQAGVDGKGWQEVFDTFFPLDIEELVVRNSEIRFRNFNTKPPVNIILSKLDIDAANINNTEKKGNKLISHSKLKASLEGGSLEMDTKFNILKNPYLFDLNLSLKHLQLPKLNDFFMAYSSFDLTKGNLDLFIEAASQDGLVTGYIKPVMTGVDVIAPNEKFTSFKNALTEMAVGVINFVFRNYRKDQTATKIPFEGRIDDPEIKVWPTIKGIFSNAFVKAFQHKLDHEVNIGDLKKVKESKKQKKKK